jgi:fatty-acyl-CoA synthase
MPLALLDRVRGDVADRVFEVGVLRRAGILGPSRPDRTVRVLKELATGGTTPAAAIRIAAIKYPDSEFIVDPRGALTFAEVDRRTDSLAASFQQMGLGEGDSIAIMCRNHRGFIEAMLAASKAGVAAIFLNTMFSGPQLVEVVSSEGASAVVHDAEFADLIAGLPDHVVTILADGPDAERSLDLMIADPYSDLVAPRSKNTRFIILTSGTTGTPKGARRSSPKGLGPIAGLLDRIPHRSGETMVVAAPLFHSWGFVNAILGLTLGARLVLDGRFDPARTMELVESHRAEVLVAVPVMLQRILEFDRDSRLDVSPGVLEITTLSGSALPGDLATRWMDRFGDNLYSLYGSTEVAFVSIAGPDELRHDPSTAGRPPRGTDVRLLDDHSDEVPPGSTGRIFVRTGMAFEGYTGGADKERIDGFVSSGDVGHFDGEGLLFVDGRDDEMIVSGGENVFPAEVEDAIARMEGVIEVAVIGAEDEKFGQALVAWVVVEGNSAPDEAEVRAHVKENLASFKAPRDVFFIDRLPRNATGKVLKRELNP